MIESGMTAMMKALGLDPAEVQKGIDAFTTHMKAQAAAINANQVRIEGKLDEIDAKLDEALDRAGGFSGEVLSTTELLDAEGKPTNVLITNERFPQAMIDDANGRTRPIVNGPVAVNAEAAAADSERSAGEA